MAGRDPNRLELRRALTDPDQQTPLTHEPLAPTPPATHPPCKAKQKNII